MTAKPNGGLQNLTEPAPLRPKLRCPYIKLSRTQGRVGRNRQTEADIARNMFVTLSLSYFFYPVQSAVQASQVGIPNDRMTAVDPHHVQLDEHIYTRSFGIMP